MTWTVFISSCLGLLAVINAWLIAKRRETFLLDIEQSAKILALQLDNAVLQERLRAQGNDISALNRQLSEFSDKINGVLAMKPLLEDVILSIRELRRSQA